LAYRAVLHRDPVVIEEADAHILEKAAAADVMDGAVPSIVWPLRSSVTLSAPITMPLLGS
jgi:hypothetical protein